MPIFLYLIILIFAVSIILYFLREIFLTHFSKNHRAPFIRSPQKAIENLQLNFFSKINDTDIVYDLGAGDGKITRAMQKYNPHPVYIGIEYQWWPFFLGKIKNKLNRTTKINWVQADIFKTDLSNADVLICYLTPELLNLVLEKAKNEINKDFKMVTIGFSLENEQEAEKYSLEDFKLFKLGSDIYIYHFNQK